MLGRIEFVCGWMMCLMACQGCGDFGHPAQSELPEIAKPERSMEEKLGLVYSPVPADMNPQVEELTLPDIPGAFAIWGSTGRDDSGQLWFGIAMHGTDSAYLLQYDPARRQFGIRGDVVSKLREAGLSHDGEKQMKIHSKICQADDGYLYFASMDETGEEEDGSQYATWGGHLWRMNLDDFRWEHLLATKEPLIALACSGRYVYSLGYFNHVVYQFDTDSQQIRDVTVGSVGGHVSRNFIVDARGHLYVPKVERIGSGTTTSLMTTLVEFNDALRPIHDTLLEHYNATPDFESHGIVGFTFLKDGSCVFTTHPGFAYHIRPPEDDGPAQVDELGWFHPDGETYVSSIFPFDGRRFLFGHVQKLSERKQEFVVYDLDTRTSRVVGSFTPQPDPGQISMELYGTQTRDDLGACYLVGRIRAQSGSRPVIYRASFDFNSTTEQASSEASPHNEGTKTP